MIKFLVVLMFLFSSNVMAECTPTPDCASIGYTETSCETISLKCPFDQTKLYCFPCDSSYQYTCSNPNEYGNSDSCKGKYKSCCNTSCSVGNIYYSDGTCNSCLDNNKTPIGVVVKDNELVISQIRSTSMAWSNTYTDTALTNYSSSTDAKKDFNGKSNTAIIVAAHPTETVDNNAAIYCNSYSTEGTNVGDWYLPSAGELYKYVYNNYSKVNMAMVNLGWIFGRRYLWSSSECDSSIAWPVFSSDSDMYGHYKDHAKTVSCFLAL